MRIFVGLKQKLEFNLISPSGELLTPKPIQILVVDAFPKSVQQTWGEIITDGFDADVIKCTADIDSDGHELKPVIFYGSALHSVHKGQFEYTMRPCHSFPQMMKRLTKYRERGFVLSKFSFDERVSEEWREHILHEFRLEYAGRWWREFVGNAGGSIYTNGLPTIVNQNVLPYLGRFDGDNLSDREVFQVSEAIPNHQDNASVVERNKKKQHAISRGMLRRNILNELVRTGYRDPGNNQICQWHLVNTWKNIDMEDDGVNMGSFWQNIGVQYPSLMENDSGYVSSGFSKQNK